MAKIKFTGHEQEVLLRVIEQQLDGIKDARTSTMEDPTIESAEQLLDYMAGLEGDETVLIEVQRKLTHAAG